MNGVDTDMHLLQFTFYKTLGFVGRIFILFFQIKNYIQKIIKCSEISFCSCKNTDVLFTAVVCSFFF